MEPGSRATLVLSCEHAGHRIPRPCAGLFAGAGKLLASHRGWDPGAMRLARLLARRFERPLFATHWSRLLVDANRSPSNPRIWSRFTRQLPRDERLRILERYWRPHREDVQAAIAAASRKGSCVVHVAVHSFTPVLDGQVRNADVAFLFDSRRPREAELARHWGALLCRHAPDLRVRYNYPYRGGSDGLATWLRRRYPAARYLGLELELNQALAAGPAWRGCGEVLAQCLAEALQPTPRPAASGRARSARRAAAPSRRSRGAGSSRRR